MSRELDLRDLECIAQRLEQSRDESGGHPFSSPTLEHMVYLLAGRSAGAGEVDQYFRTSWDALMRAAESRPVTAQAIREAVGRARTEFEQGPRLEFLFVSSLSVAVPPEFRKREVDGWDIEVHEQLPANINRNLGDNSLLNRLTQRILPGRWVVARGRARSEDEAVGSALAALDALRGSWALPHGEAVWAGLGIGPTRPMNPILLGPIHSLHTADGTPVPSRVWCEEKFPHSGALPWDLGHWPEAASVEAAVLDPENPLNPWLRRVVVRYCRALDLLDPELAFIQLWSVIELLVGTDRERRYRRTVDRICGFFSNADRVDYLLMDLLREQRNNSVHTGVFSELRRQGLDILHGYVTRILRFAVDQSSRFQNECEFFSFLDIPKDAKRLKREIDLRVLVEEWSGHAR